MSDHSNAVVLPFTPNPTAEAASNDASILITENLQDHLPKIDVGVIDIAATSTLASQVEYSGLDKQVARESIAAQHRHMGDSRTLQAGRKVQATKIAAENQKSVAMAESAKAKLERDKHQKHTLVQADKPKPLTFAEKTNIALIVTVLFGLLGWGVVANAAYLQAAGLASGFMAYLIGALPVIIGKCSSMAIERGIDGERAKKIAMLISGAALAISVLVWAFTIGSEGGQNTNPQSLALAAGADPLGLGGVSTALPVSNVEFRSISRMMAQVTLELVGSFVLFFLLNELQSQAGNRYVKFSTAEQCPVYAAYDADYTAQEDLVKRLTQIIEICVEWQKSRVEAINAFVAKADGAFLSNLSLISTK